MAVVLLTGAIRPAAVPLALADPRERLLETLCAITCWLGEPAVDRVVYFDGSGFLFPTGLFDSSRFLAVTDYFGDAARIYGKGRADASIIAAAAASGVVGDAFYKSTGRLYVENFADIDMALDRSLDFATTEGAIRVPTRVPGLRRSLRAVETTFFWARTRFVIERLVPLTGEIDDSRETSFIETVYARVSRARGTAPLTPKPVLVGRSASRGKPYVRDFDHALRESCRALARGIDLG